jgi:hypothetical protein
MAPWEAFLRSILRMQISHHVLHVIQPAELPPPRFLHRANRVPYAYRAASSFSFIADGMNRK